MIIFVIFDGRNIHVEETCLKDNKGCILGEKY